MDIIVIPLKPLYFVEVQEIFNHSIIAAFTMNFDVPVHTYSTIYDTDFCFNSHDRLNVCFLFRDLLCKKWWIALSSCFFWFNFLFFLYLNWFDILNITT